MAIPATFEEAHAAVVGLVDNFEQGKAYYLSSAYQEQEARLDFLDKFFIALGWDVQHVTQRNPYEQEVKIERSVITGGAAKRRADYSFSLAPHFTKRPKFFVEAKRPSVDIASPDNYFQAIRYSWSHQLPIVVLTDFYSFHIIDSRYRPDIKYALNRRISTYSYTDYRDADVFAKIYYLFSREAAVNDAIPKYADTLEKPSAANKQLGLFAGGYQSIDEAFLEQLDQYRDDLARSFKKLNPQLGSQELTEAVQRTLDRLVFTRFLEDKLIEPNPIIATLGAKGAAWKQFVRESDRLDKIYNGVVYKPHPLLDSPTFKVDDTAFLHICDDISDPTSPYDFNAIPVEILGRIYERFLGKVVVATAKQARVEDKPDVRKAGGVYYTPGYIVADMVDKALGPKVRGKPPDEIVKVRVIDTSCGSGSFLIGVYEYLLHELARTYAEKPRLAKKRDVVERDGVLHLSISKKREVLVECLFGIDIDAQAVEVTQLSLYLKLLEDETTASAQSQQMELAAALLPSLNSNIIVGNSLISPVDDAKADDFFEIERYESLRAVNIRRAFPKVMQRHGGFDLVIGNPPYIKEYTNKDAFDNVRDSPYYMGKMDIWYLFACRAFDILKPTDGTLAFIATNNWTTNYGAKRLREKVAADARIEYLIDFGDFKIFRDAGIQTMILVAQRSSEPNQYQFDYRKLIGKKRTLAEAQALLTAEGSHIDIRLRPTFNRNVFSDGKPLTFSDSDSETLLLKIAAADFRLNPTHEIAQGIVAPQDALNKKAVTQLGQRFTLGQGVFVLDSTELEMLELSAAERALVKPYFTTQELGRYWGRPTNRNWIIYTDSAFKQPASMRHLPKLKAHLDQFRKIITSSNKPYGLHRARQERFFTGPKIIATRKCLRPTFTYVEHDCYVSQTFNIIKTDRVDPKFLTGVLNSRVVEYWLKHKGKMQGDHFQIDNEPLAAIPIVTATEAGQAQIAALIDRILAASAKRDAASTDLQAIQYARLIEQTDAEIQEHLYQFYGLTPEEIAVVEESTVR
jgi:adenine-specific DNA-methyltransferase